MVKTQYLEHSYPKRNKGDKSSSRLFKDHEISSNLITEVPSVSAAQLLMF